jgi:hypothetical protein
MSKQTQPSEKRPLASPPRPPENAFRLARRHLRFGWWTLLVFLTLGIVLEGLQLFKVGWYLDVIGQQPAAQTRREMLRLAHSHGTLLALVHLAFAASLLAVDWLASKLRSLASACLFGASIALPAGYLLGGMYNYGTEPGLGVLLVPVGAFLLLVGVLAAALSMR